MRGPWIWAASIAWIPAASAWAQTTQRVSVDSGGVQSNGPSYRPWMTPDGRYVGFDGAASNLVAGDSNGVDDVFLYDRQTGLIERVSVATGGTQSNGPSNGASVSTDGRYVAYQSDATNLDGSDLNLASDAYVRDRATGTTERVSVSSGGAVGNSHSYGPVLSPDGRFVLFRSLAGNLVVPDTNGVMDVFLRDRQTGTTERVSLTNGGAEGNGASSYATMSSDGRYVAFASLASNLVAGDTNAVSDVFVRDRTGGTTVRVSVATGGAEGNDASGFGSPVAISEDGRYVAFESLATNLVAGDTNATFDVFLRDLVSGTTERLSVSSGGAEGSLDSQLRSRLVNGRFVAFVSNAPNLVAGDTNSNQDVFLRDRLTGTTERVSLGATGAQGNFPSGAGDPVSVSADGRYVAFETNSDNLVTGDTNSVVDIFVRDRGIPAAFTFSCSGDGTGGACPCANWGVASHGCENSTGTGGALLTASGSAKLSADTLQLISSGELTTSSSIFLQGDTTVGATAFGDGLRCAGGNLKRLFVKFAVAGMVTAPIAGDPTISARSSALGDLIHASDVRRYQVYYRDPDGFFCPTPTGNTFNASNMLTVTWVP